ncbi:hypothetical protein [Paraburkholderia tropica]|uniref:hypothetical protein n=1 Tax=Paraburkholderia tropica TaxID=92647 RepID=UPI002AAF518E|nr:hypothetical protein [Paraburkholderia tropica]
MTALQTVTLGTAPSGTDGDTVRTANVKANANVAVLNTQATLSSSSPNAVRDLTAADMGKRVNFTPTAAGTVHLPKASDTGADQLVAVHNLATAYDITMAIATGSGDTAPTIVVVKPGEMLTWETDGVSAWRTIGRKKAFDEAVQGKLSVAGSLTVGGNSSATNYMVSGAAGSARQVLMQTGILNRFGLSISATAEGGSNAGSDFSIDRYSDAGVYVDSPIKVSRSTGASVFSQRPTFGTATPWDTANLALGQCRLSLSGSNLLLSRCDGSFITIGGVAYQIPAGGVTLAPTGAAAATLYYIYAYMSSGAMALAYSTSPPVQDAYGVYVATNNAAYTLVGMVYCQSAGSWSPAGSQYINLLSYFNRRSRFASQSTSGAAQVNTAWTNCGVLIWGDDAGISSFSGFGNTPSSGNTSIFNHQIDGSVYGNGSRFSNVNGGYAFPISSSISFGGASSGGSLSQGWHLVGCFGQNDGQIVTASIAQTVMVRG